MDENTTVVARPAPHAVRHSEQVWGTVVTFDVRDVAFTNATPQQIHRAITDACSWLHDVDRIFSTYRDDSLVTAIRRGDSLDQMREAFTARDRELLSDVLDACEQCEAFTEGAFDAWELPGGFDPSGFVKGWAAQMAADILSEQGLRYFMIDAGGDVVCRGGESPTEPWHIGIRHPYNPDQVMTTVTVTDGTVATSGTYERGEHLYDPETGEYAAVARAATVVGPDAGIADAMATAIALRGESMLKKVHALSGGAAAWSALVVIGDIVTSIGDLFG